MLSEKYEFGQVGILRGPKEKASVFNVLKYIEKQLPRFAEEYSRSRIKNEKGLTQNLCLMLNRFTEEYPFYFHKEFMEVPERGDSPQIDIGVISRHSNTINSRFYNVEESFFAMEAKRLDDVGKKREKEYLIGRFENGKYIDCGGVERFKKEIHGRNVDYGVLIGYVQKYDFNYWYNKIDGWIDNFISYRSPRYKNWVVADKLLKQCNRSTYAKYKSKNKRRRDSITLFHLWINLVKSD